MENESCGYSLKKNLVMNTREINPPVNSESNKRYSFHLNTIDQSTFLTDRSNKKYSVDIRARKDKHEDKNRSLLENSYNYFDSVKSINISSKNNEDEMCKYVNKYVLRKIKCWSNAKIQV